MLCKYLNDPVLAGNKTSGSIGQFLSVLCDLLPRGALSWTGNILVLHNLRMGSKGFYRIRDM